MPRTDRDLAKLEARLKKLYQKVFDELDIEVDHYLNGWDEVIDDKVVHHMGMYERIEQERASGKYTEKQLREYIAAQEGRGEHWKKLRDQMGERLAHTNEDACAIINKGLTRVYVDASNGIALEAKAQAISQGASGISFELVDEATIQRLIKKPNAHLPFYIAQNDTKKDIKWNCFKLQNQLIQGILKGESPYKIADRFQATKNMNRSTAIRNARTTITSARNAGKQDRYDDLSKQGVEITKVWNAELDERVRDEHADADGQEVPYDEPFEVGGELLMYPGDISLGAHGWNVLNCRCSMKTGRYKFHSILTEEQRNRANIRIVR